MAPLQVAATTADEKSAPLLSAAQTHASSSSHTKDHSDVEAYDVWPAKGKASWRELRESGGKTLMVERKSDDLITSAKALPELTLEDVAKKVEEGQLWIVIEAYAYDLTKFADAHPGGRLVLEDVAGVNCTDAFTEYHPAEVWSRLPAYRVGRIVGKHSEPSEFVLAHRRLRQQLLAEGCFETRMTFYAKLAAWCTLLLGAVLYFGLACSSFAAHMVSAALLGLWWQQIAFVGHDLGHSSVTHSRRKDELVGSVVGSLFQGISIAWWKRSHNVHHVVTNSSTHDPNIQHMPLIAVNTSLLANNSFYSTYHRIHFRYNGIARFFLSRQHWLYYPLMAVARFNLYAQSWILIFDLRIRVPSRRLEAVCLTLFFVWLGALLWAIGHGESTAAGAAQHRICYLLLSHAVAGLLHVQITLSHFSMPTYVDVGLDTEAVSQRVFNWFVMQTATSLNVDCSPYLDWFHGGLQFQVEHHIFPRLPRHSLRRARELVQAFCKERGLEYNETSFVDANRMTIDSLRKTAYDVQACADFSPLAKVLDMAMG